MPSAMTSPIGSWAGRSSDDLRRSTIGIGGGCRQASCPDGYGSDEAAELPPALNIGEYVAGSGRSVYVAGRAAVPGPPNDGKKELGGCLGVRPYLPILLCRLAAVGELEWRRSSTSACCGSLPEVRIDCLAYSATLISSLCWELPASAVTPTTEIPCGPYSGSH